MKSNQLNQNNDILLTPNYFDNRRIPYFNIYNQYGLML